MIRLYLGTAAYCLMVLMAVFGIGYFNHQAQGQTIVYTSTTLDNEWLWTPAAGDPPYYQMQIMYQGTGEWLFLENAEGHQLEIPPTVVDGFVEHTHTSPGPEVYQVRARAADDDANFGEWSDPSGYLEVTVPKYSKTGTPQPSKGFKATLILEPIEGDTP